MIRRHGAFDSSEGEDDSELETSSADSESGQVSELEVPVAPLELEPAAKEEELEEGIVQWANLRVLSQKNPPMLILV